MCDDRTAKEDEAFLRNNNALSRRSFGIMSAAALAACAVSPAGAETVTESEVVIATPDGMCDAHFVHPASGRHPGVIVWPDIMGLRPAFRVMGKRLAESGYAVLTVNPFYRQARAPILTEGQSFSDPDTRQRLIGMMRAFTPQTQTSDAAAFVSWLDAQGAVDTHRKIGTTGYCMGGSFVIRTAAGVPNRIGAGGTFHGGGLATANPDSPHLLIPQTRANFLIAIAQNDDESDPAAKETLRAAFAAANRPAEIEVYPARHGWCAIDSQVYDQVQADRAWARLLALFSTALA
jgi:carboxymethylenebutenolidase